MTARCSSDTLWAANQRASRSPAAALSARGAQVVVRDSLPRTASNKVMRRLLRDQPPPARL
jgi:acyl-coenzyme A synthetase/AMP-(fatty) acid ligase